MKKKIVVKPKTVKTKPKLKVSLKPKKKLTTVSKKKKQTALKTIQKAKKTGKVKIPADSKKKKITTDTIEKGKGKCGRCSKSKKACKCGRPTKYEGKKTIESVIEFMNECVVEAEREVKSESHGATSESTGYDVVYTIKTLPTKYRLSKHLGISRSILYEWIEKHKEFSDIVEELDQIYEEILVLNGLNGKFNSKVAGLLLSSKFGYAEKKDHRLESATGLFDVIDEEDE